MSSYAPLIRRSPVSPVSPRARAPQRSGASSRTNIRIGATSDPLELEAERTAARVAAGHSAARLQDTAPTPVVQRACEACGQEDELARVQRAAVPGGTSTVPSAIGATLLDRARTRAGAPLVPELRRRMEASFQLDFSTVRIHDDADSARAARQLHARAFTLGRDIFFARDQFRPHARDGVQLLAHELTHVAQQPDSGTSPVIRRAPQSNAPSAAELALERIRTLIHTGLLSQALLATRGLSASDRQHVILALDNIDVNALIQFAEPNDPLRAQIESERRFTRPMFPGSQAGSQENASREALTSDIVDPIRRLLREDRAHEALALLEGLSDRRFALVVDTLQAGEATALLRAARGRRGLRKRIRGLRSRELVINTVLATPAADSIDAQFQRANNLFAPLGIEVERGRHTVIPVARLFTGIPVGKNHERWLQTGGNTRHSEDERSVLRHIAEPDRITAFWVPNIDTGDTRGKALRELDNLFGAPFILFNARRYAPDTLAHEIGHIVGLPHAPQAPENLMSQGGKRKLSGPPGAFDQINWFQASILRRSRLLELGRRGLGR